MAGKISDLTELTSVASGDFVELLDVSDTTDSASGSSRKMTRANLISGLAASGANSDITSLTGLTTALSVAQGGTGATTLTAGGILYGAGTSAIAASAAGTAGQVVLSGGAGSPTFTTGTLTLAGNLITSGASSLTLTTTGATNVTLPTTGTLATLAGSETLSGKTLTAPKFADLGYIADANGNEMLIFNTVTSAVNQFRISNSIAGNPANLDIEATGDSSNINIRFYPSGTGKTIVLGNDLELDVATANIQVNGADPWRIISLTPGFLKPTTTAGCAPSVQVEAGTNDIDYDVLDFDSASEEGAYANFQMPTSWDAGVVNFRYIWTCTGGGAAQSVRFQLAGHCYVNDDAIDQAVGGTPTWAADTWIADGDVHVSTWSGDVTIENATAGGYIHFLFTREVAEANDTLAVDCRIIAVQIRYKQAQFSD